MPKFKGTIIPMNLRSFDRWDCRSEYAGYLPGRSFVVRTTRKTFSTRCSPTAEVLGKLRDGGNISLNAIPSPTSLKGYFTRTDLYSRVTKISRGGEERSTFTGSIIRFAIPSVI